MRLLLVTCFTLTSASATYPSTFPYENENIETPLLPAGGSTYENGDFTPENDPGGYPVRLALCDLNAGFENQAAGQLKATTGQDLDILDNMFDVVGFCGESAYTFVNQWALPPVLPTQTWNCTKTGLVMESNWFLGTLGGASVCVAGTCCSWKVGHVGYSEEISATHEFWTKHTEIGMCDTLNEPAYCYGVDGLSWHCFERYQAPGDRLWTNNCVDSVFRWYLTCKVFLNTGLYGLAAGFTLDSPIYENALSIEESFLMRSHLLGVDKVCHPYSYYFPDTSPSDGSGENGTSNNDTETESSCLITATISGALVLLTN